MLNLRVITLFIFMMVPLIGFSQNSEGNSSKPSLFKAIKNGNVGLVNALISNGAEIEQKDVDGKTPLQVAIEIGNSEIIKLLISADENSRGMLEISRSGLISLIKNFIKKGVSVKKDPALKESPLHVAARAIRSPLLEGYDVEESTRIEMAKIFISNGASVSSLDEHGKTPLHLAVETRFPDMMKLLLDHGADINKPNKWGSTPLHIAAVYCTNDIIELLLKNGANPAILNKANKTPGEVAPCKNTKEMLKLKKP